VDASDAAQLLLYRSLAADLAAGSKALLITRIPSDRNDLKTLEQCLAKHDGSAIGTLGCDSLTMRELLSSFCGYQPRCIELRGERFLLEPLGSEGVVYIFGAGHIGQQLAALTALVGFQTVVLDDREEFASDGRFASADRIIIPDSFEQAMDGLEVDQHSYIVIVTRGHRHDQTVLAQALKTRAGYIGMIGSSRKCASTYEALAREGFTTEDLGRVHCPVGLPIGAQTPEEIAVSIVAELIQAKYARKSC
jgi:xanthine dehydrogenase accessory factor